MARKPSEAYRRAVKRAEGKDPVREDQEKASAELGAETFGLYLEPPPPPLTKRKRGRPSTFDQKIADHLLEEMSLGQRSIRSICEDEGMPFRSTIFKWVLDYPEFARKFELAREIQQHSYADDIIYISDTEKDPQVARVRIDARKWTSSRLLPKVYGEKVSVDANVNQTSVNVDLLAKLTDEEREVVRTVLGAAMKRIEDERAEAEAGDRKMIEGVVR